MVKQDEVQNLTSVPPSLRGGDWEDKVISELVHICKMNKLLSLENAKVWNWLKDTEQRLATELRHLNSVDRCLNEWLDKTQWVQTSAQSHELGMHRADVISQRFSEITKQRDELLVALKEISAIENQDYGADWEEIEQARNIANVTIAKVTGETK